MALHIRSWNHRGLSFLWLLAVWALQWTAASPQVAGEGNVGCRNREKRWQSSPHEGVEGCHHSDKHSQAGCFTDYLSCQTWD